MLSLRRDEPDQGAGRTQEVEPERNTDAPGIQFPANTIATRRVSRGCSVGWAAGVAHVRPGDQLAGCCITPWVF